MLMGGLLVFIAVTPAAGVTADRLPRQLIAWTSYLQEVIPAEQLSRILATNARIGTFLVSVAYSVVGPSPIWPVCERYSRDAPPSSSAELRSQCACVRCDG